MRNHFTHSVIVHDIIDVSFPAVAFYALLQKKGQGCQR